MHPRIPALLMLLVMFSRIAADEPRATLLASTQNNGNSQSTGLRFRMPLAVEGDFRFGIEATILEGFEYHVPWRSTYSSYSYSYQSSMYYGDPRSAIASGSGLFLATDLTSRLDLSLASSLLWTSAPMTLVRAGLDAGYHFSNRLHTRFGIAFERNLLHRDAIPGTYRINDIGVHIQAGFDFDNDAQLDRVRNGFLTGGNLIVIGLYEAYQAAHRR